MVRSIMVRNVWRVVTRVAATALACASCMIAIACDRSAMESADALARFSAAHADTVPSRFARNLVGTMAGNAVEVTLWRDGDRMWGSTSDDETGFEGTVAKDGAVVLSLWNPRGPAPDTLRGTLSAGPEGLALRGALHGLAGPRPVELAEERFALDSGARLTARDIAEGDSAAGFTIYAQIPVLVPPEARALTAAELGFNEAAEALVDQQLDEFRRFIGESEPLPPEWTGAPVSSFNSAYDVALADAELLSLEFGISIYYAGAVHPGHLTRTLTWDLGSNRVVELADLFQNGIDYLARISETTIPAIERALGDDADAAWIAEGAGPNPANYESWMLTPEGLRIVFDQYQVAPYAAGPQTVVVPWRDLAPHLDPAGPAARLAP